MSVSCAGSDASEILEYGIDGWYNFLAGIGYAFGLFYCAWYAAVGGSLVCFFTAQFLLYASWSGADPLQFDDEYGVEEHLDSANASVGP